MRSNRDSRTRAVQRFYAVCQAVGEERPDRFRALRDALILLRSDAFDPRLRTHKLRGDLTGLLACSAAYDLRIVFEIAKEADAELILLVSCGTHDEVY